MPARIVRIRQTALQNCPDGPHTLLSPLDNTKNQPHDMAEWRQHHSKPRGFLLHRALSVINYNVLNAPSNSTAGASGSHAARKRELVLRHIAEKEAAAARAEAQTQARRRRLVQRAGGRAAASRASTAGLEPEQQQQKQQQQKQQQQQQGSHAVGSSRSARDGVGDFLAFLGNVIEMSREDEAAFHAELAQFD